MPEPLEYFTPDPDEFPGDLKAVAWVFVAFGCLSVVQMAMAIVRGGFNLNLGCLEIFVGVGIFQHNASWRTCGLVFNWLSMIGGVAAAIAFIVVLANSGGDADAFFVLPIIVAIVAANGWQYRVLTRPNVRRIFGLGPVR